MHTLLANNRLSECYEGLIWATLGAAMANLAFKDDTANEPSDWPIEQIDIVATAVKGNNRALALDVVSQQRDVRFDANRASALLRELLEKGWVDVAKALFDNLPSTTGGSLRKWGKVLAPPRVIAQHSNRRASKADQLMAAHGALADAVKSQSEGRWAVVAEGTVRAQAKTLRDARKVARKLGLKNAVVHLLPKE